MEPRSNGHHAPLDLSALLRRSARIEIEYAGETFGVEYLPHAITTDVYLELLAATSGDTSSTVEVLGVLLAKLIGSWEIEMDGKPLPVTAETMRLFPIGLLAEISTAIMEHVADPTQAPAENSTPSSSGALAEAASGSAPTGTV